MRSTLAIAALLAGALTVSGGALAEQSSTSGSSALTSPAVDPVQSDKGSQAVPENPSGDTSAAAVPPTVGTDKGGQVVPPPNTAKD
jgi:hypothetical protein